MKIMLQCSKIRMREDVGGVTNLVLGFKRKGTLHSKMTMPFYLINNVEDIVVFTGFQVFSFDNSYTPKLKFQTLISNLIRLSI